MAKKQIYSPLQVFFGFRLGDFSGSPDAWLAIFESSVYLTVNFFNEGIFGYFREMINLPGSIVQTIRGVDFEELPEDGVCDSGAVATVSQNRF